MRLPRLFSACLLLAPALAAQVVTTPPLWVAGDTHEMIQLCTVPGGAQPPDRPLGDVLLEMQQKNLSVMDVLVLVTGPTSCWQYLGQYVPMVTGSEHTLTQGDPNKVLFMGIEVVGGPDPRCPYPAWGHVVGLGIQDAAYVLDADYPSLNLDFIKAQPGALAGYPHVAWPTGVRVPDDFPPIDRAFTRLHPLLAPFDVAAGRVDFLSTPDVSTQATIITPHPWWGLWYKLLNAGFRVSITGGTVAQCYTALGNLDARTYALLDSPVLDHAGWLRAIDEGRTSIANGVEDFLLLEVEGQDVGGSLYLSGTPQVFVHAELHTSVPRQTTLEIIQNGVVIASDPVDLTTPGVHVFELPIPVAESGWLAARTVEAHTGAVFTYVDDLPITDRGTTDYFQAFGKQLLDFLDLANLICGGCPTSTCPPCQELEHWVGNSEPAIREEIQRGRDRYRIMGEYLDPLPNSILRFGRSSPGCQGPIGIALKAAPSPGQKTVVVGFNAPPNAQAILTVAAKAQVPGVSYRGAKRFVSFNPSPRVYYGLTDAAGYIEFEVPVQVLPVPIEAYGQIFFQNAPGCPAPNGGELSATPALRVQLPRSLYRPK